MTQTTQDPVTEYLVDAAQRTVLFWDVMRQRGNQYREHMAQTAPHVLGYEFELVADGRALPQPVNYGLVRIVPPAGVQIDERRRPFVIVDPRAGHGPGIGGFKADSEIGVALRAGHPCYFVGFTPTPEPGQTIEAVLRAEEHFLEIVVERHPDAEGRPVVIGNCQAGWAVMMLAAVRPDLCGPLIIAGAPMSYWAGVRGKNPMRYSGGLLGGSWLTALTGDLGNGIFDGASLVTNFEGMNPANTLWNKQYNVYSKVDTEGPRYLEFERWWGGHVLLNATEMQWIVDNLFVGNKLATADIALSDGTQVDLRNIRSPIVIFCSKGDNITPPQQALGWVPDLYQDVEDIRVAGQTIVYAVHESIGHLGIFVSGGVAKKEHREFTENIDLIDCLPPGLYEAVLTDKAGQVGADLASGDYIARFEQRTVDDIRALGRNDEADERCFAAVARASEATHGLYRSFTQPFVRAAASAPAAEFMRNMHPSRTAFEVFSDFNPMMVAVSASAATVRGARRPVSEDNPLLAWEKGFSQCLTLSLNTYRDVRDAMVEGTFFALYGHPLTQALLGLAASDEPPRRHPGMSPEHGALVRERVSQLRDAITQGGLCEAAIRALVYIRMPTQLVDERGFRMLHHIVETEGSNFSLSQFKQLVREQFFMLCIDERAAIDALPAMIADQQADARTMMDRIRTVVAASDTMNDTSRQRLEEIAAVFAPQAPPARMETVSRRKKAAEG